jgi:AraC-type DNA-binding domain-containing proteins
MNEMDEYIFTDTCDIQMAVLYFHPGIISPCFNFQNIRVTEKESFDDVQLQDLYLLYPFLHRNTDNNGLLKLGEDTFTRVHKLVELIGRELTLQKDNAWPCRSRSYFLELLILITKIYESNQKVSDVMLTEATEDITVVLNYLNNNYQEKITLQQLSEMFATNRTSLNNRFYKATNLSVIDYLINLRIQVAAAMLRDTQLPISEIMIRVGFNNSTHFWRTFKKYHSLSPKEYRDQYCWVKA